MIHSAFLRAEKNVYVHVCTVLCFCYVLVINFCSPGEEDQISVPHSEHV